MSDEGEWKMPKKSQKSKKATTKKPIVLNPHQKLLDIKAVDQSFSLLSEKNQLHRVLLTFETIYDQILVVAKSPFTLDTVLKLSKTHSSLHVNIIKSNMQTVYDMYDGYVRREKEEEECLLSHQAQVKTQHMVAHKLKYTWMVTMLYTFFKANEERILSLDISTDKDNDIYNMHDTENIHNVNINIETNLHSDHGFSTALCLGVGSVSNSISAQHQFALFMIIYCVFSSNLADILMFISKKDEFRVDVTQLDTASAASTATSTATSTTSTTTSPPSLPTFTSSHTPLPISSLLPRIYDPIFSLMEKCVLEQWFQVKVLTNNEEAKVQISSHPSPSTLSSSPSSPSSPLSSCHISHSTSSHFIYLPHCGISLTSNLLWANWGQNLASIIFMGNSMERALDLLKLGKAGNERIDIVKSVDNLPYIPSFTVETNDNNQVDTIELTSLSTEPLYYTSLKEPGDVFPILTPNVISSTHKNWITVARLYPFIHELSLNDTLFKENISAFNDTAIHWIKIVKTKDKLQKCLVQSQSIPSPQLAQTSQKRKKMKMILQNMHVGKENIILNQNTFNTLLSIRPPEYRPDIPPYQSIFINDPTHGDRERNSSITFGNDDNNLKLFIDPELITKLVKE